MSASQIDQSAVDKGFSRNSRLQRARIAACAMLLASGSAIAQDSACRYVKLGTLPVTFNNYRPTVVGTVNDKSALMLVDTGADSTVLTMPGVTRHGLSAVRTAGVLLGVNGASEMKYARIESVSIGGIKGARQDMPVIVQMQGGDSIDVLVGANFLFQADVEFNLAKPEISFFQPVSCSKAFLAYWDGDAYFIGTNRTTKTDRRPEFTVQVNGHDVDAIIDSGAPISMIDIDVAADAGVSVNSPGVVRAGMSAGIGGHPVPLYLGTFDTVTIGAETLRKAKLLISDMKGGYQGSSDAALFGPKMLLGADFLKAHRVLFAVSQNKIYISYMGGEVFAGNLLQVPVRTSPAAGQQGASSTSEPPAAPLPGAQPAQQ